MSEKDRYYQQAREKLAQFHAAEFDDPSIRARPGQRPWSAGSFIDRNIGPERVRRGRRRQSQLLGTFHRQPDPVRGGRLRMADDPRLNIFADQDFNTSPGLRKHLHQQYDQQRQSLAQTRGASPSLPPQHDNSRSMHQQLLHQGRRFDREGNLRNAEDMTFGDVMARTNDPRTRLIRARDAGLITNDEIQRLSGENRGRILAPGADGQLEEVSLPSRLPRQMSPELMARVEQLGRDNVNTAVDPRAVQGRMSITTPDGRTVTNERDWRAYQPEANKVAAFDQLRRRQWAESAEGGYADILNELHTRGE